PISAAPADTAIRYEARRLTASPYILYMDDDIEIEPDSILRALAFGRMATAPMLAGAQMLNLQDRSHRHPIGAVVGTHERLWRAGGQMLNLQERSHLHTMGEVVGTHDFMWTAAPHADSTTTSPRTRSRTGTTPSRCTAGSTWTTTAGGCASTRGWSRRRSASRC